MRFPISNLSWMLILALLLGGCDPEFSDPVGDSDDYDAGDADPSAFITVGDSLTAGYMDGALFREGQVNSYGNIIAGQLDKIPGEDVDFRQPLMPVGATGSLTGVPTTAVRDRLVVWPNPDFDPTDPDSRPVTPATIDPTADAELYPAVTAGGPYDNFGVPGAKSFHLSPLAVNYGDPAGVAGATANPFFVRFASSTTTSLLADAAARAPSLFVLWIGNNDILLYAIDGGVGAETITPDGTFDAAYGAIIATLKTPTNKGVLVNLPDIASIPYFSTIPYLAIPVTSQAEADLLNAGYGDYNDALDALVPGVITQAEADRRRILFNLGVNPVVVLDDTLTDLTGVDADLVSMRPATVDDYILLPALSKIGEEDTPGDPRTIWGVSKPLEDEDVLNADEATAVQAARNHYNDTIEAAAAADDDLLLFDAEALLEELASVGISYGTGRITADFLTGGGFSLDGVHPTPRGYAVVANAIIDVINEGFGASVPRVDPGAYPTVFYQ